MSNVSLTVNGVGIKEGTAALISHDWHGGIIGAKWIFAPGFDVGATVGVAINKNSAGG